MSADASNDFATTEYDVVVIGAGISGLVAARDLALGGARVAVCELADRPGGRIAETALGNTSFDLGAEGFATRTTAVAELCAELGLADQIVSPAPLGSWLVQAKPDSRTGMHTAQPLPAAGSLGIPTHPLSRASRRVLGPLGAARAVIEPLLPPRVGQHTRSWGELVAARLGPRVRDRLVAPVALGVYSTDPQRLRLDVLPALKREYARCGSLVTAARTLRASSAATGGAIAGLRGGMHTLIAALCDELRAAGVLIRPQNRVHEIHRAADGWLVDGIFTRAVLLAVPEREARRLMPEVQWKGEAAAAVPVEVVLLQIEGAQLGAAPRGTGALVAHAPHSGDNRGERIAAKALTHVTAKWGERATGLPQGHHVLRLSYGRPGEPPATAGLSDAEAAKLAARDATRILGLDTELHVVAHARQAWTNTTRSAAAAHLERGALAPGVWCAGDWVSGTGLASVVPAARETARHILEHVNAPAHRKTVTHDA